MPDFDEDALAIVRRAYAAQMLAVAGIADDPALLAAFAAVPRERFLGSPPWRLALRSGLQTLAEADPVLAYQDVLFALAPERGVNNGSPSLHARWLHHARLRPGERVVHVGAGTGYYTALLAQLVGPAGRVTAVEFDEGLAALAKGNLAHLPQVAVTAGDGALWPEEDADCVYVNFSCERPAAPWIDRLGPGGRLLFPLGVPWPGKSRFAMRGAGLRIERQDAERFAAACLGPAVFVCAEGDGLRGSEREREALKAAFERGGIDFVRSLLWRRPPSATRSWFIGADWSLGYDEAA